MVYPNFIEEKKLWKKGYKYVAGLDEAGRGPLAGPVVAAAVMINPKHEIRLIPQNYSEPSRAVRFPKQRPKGTRIFKIQNSKHVSDFDILVSDLKIRDSKLLSPKQREEVYEKLTNYPGIQWGVGMVSEKVIDKINILEATKLAMQKAVKKLNADFLLIDGNFRLDISLPQKSIIRGDQKVISIAASSIIAKVTRDRIMKKYHKKYPRYGFASHKGYPTRAHFAALQKFGPCDIHRKTFWPVKIFTT